MDPRRTLKLEILRRVKQYRTAVDSLYQRDAEEYEPLREAVDLLARTLALLETASPDQIHKALGAPGDFGYHGIVGNAMYNFYRSPGPEEQRDGG